MDKELEKKLEETEEEKVLNLRKKVKNDQRNIRRKKSIEINALKLKQSGLLPKHNSTVVDVDASSDVSNDDAGCNEGRKEDSVVIMLWKFTSLCSKVMLKSKVCNEDLPIVGKYAIQKAINYNCGNGFTDHVANSSELCKDVENFFMQDDVTYVS